MTYLSTCCGATADDWYQELQRCPDCKENCEFGQDWDDEDGIQTDEPVKGRFYTTGPDYDGPGSIMGYGQTAEDSRADYLEQIDEDQVNRLISNEKVFAALVFLAGLSWSVGFLTGVMR